MGRGALAQWVSYLKAEGSMRLSRLTLHLLSTSSGQRPLGDVWGRSEVVWLKGPPGLGTRTEVWEGP